METYLRSKRTLASFSQDLLVFGSLVTVAAWDASIGNDTCHPRTCVSGSAQRTGAMSARCERGISVRRSCLEWLQGYEVLEEDSGPAAATYTVSSSDFLQPTHPLPSLLRACRLLLGSRGAQSRSADTEGPPDTPILLPSSIWAPGATPSSCLLWLQHMYIRLQNSRRAPAWHNMSTGNMCGVDVQSLLITWSPEHPSESTYNLWSLSRDKSFQLGMGHRRRWTQAHIHGQCQSVR